MRDENKTVLFSSLIPHPSSLLSQASPSQRRQNHSTASKASNAPRSHSRSPSGVRRTVSGPSEMVSSVSEPGLEATAGAAKGPKIFQLYVRGDDAWVEDIIDRAVAAGYDAFAFTDLDEAGVGKSGERFPRGGAAFFRRLDDRRALLLGRIVRHRDGHRPRRLVSAALCRRCRGPTTTRPGAPRRRRR